MNLWKTLFGYLTEFCVYDYMTDVQVIDFVEVKNNPCICIAIVSYGDIYMRIRVMYRKKSGLTIELPKAPQRNGWVHCCWFAEKDRQVEFQLIVIRQLTEKFPDAKRIIDSKLKKVVQ
jgi:hypothetical protein